MPEGPTTRELHPPRAKCRCCRVSLIHQPGLETMAAQALLAAIVLAGAGAFILPERFCSRRRDVSATALLVIAITTHRLVVWEVGLGRYGDGLERWYARCSQPLSELPLREGIWSFVIPMLLGLLGALIATRPADLPWPHERMFSRLA